MLNVNSVMGEAEGIVFVALATPVGYMEICILTPYIPITNRFFGIQNSISPEL